MTKRLRAEEAAPLPRKKVRPDHVLVMDDIPPTGDIPMMDDFPISEELAEVWLGRPGSSRHSDSTRSQPAERRKKTHVRRLLLVALEGYLAGVSWEFGESFVVGRGEDMDLPLDDASVCRSHAELFPAAVGWEVADLGSMHGTHLNGGRLSPGSWPLRRHDVLRIGTVTLLVKCCD
ncbi:MAG: FHA domain-containing protein [Planctomycetes bacterium]|nr:FHA domain-containing protein [Planctomycetota bacterium]